MRPHARSSSPWLALLLVAACGGSSTTPPPVDTPPPAPVIDAAPPAIGNAEQTTFTFHADGATGFTCALDGAAPVACMLPYVVHVGEGDHTLVVRAYAGDAAGPPVTFAWTVDLTPPRSVITQAPPAVDNSTSPQIAFASAVAGDAARFECALDTGAFAMCTSPIQVTVGAGSHELRVRAIDRAGNVEAAPVSARWAVDLGTIDTSITSGPSGGPTGADVVFTFATATAGATFECQLDAIPFYACASPAVLTGLGEGSHTFRVRAVQGGVADPTPAAQTWPVDLTPPPVSITQTPPPRSNVVTPTFAFSSTDATATFRCQVDGGFAYQACTSPFTTPTLTKGPKIFRVRATDVAGNFADASYAWDIGLGAPMVAWDSGPTSGTTSPLATWAWSSEQGDLTYECELDGAFAYTPCTSPYSHVVPGGTQRFHLRATDPYGNTRVLEWAWVENLPGPTVQFDLPVPTLINTTTITLAFTSAGAVAATECSLDGAAYAACSSPVTYSGLTEASHTAVVRVRDAAGNASTDARTFVVDVTPPTVQIVGFPTLVSNRQPTVTFTTTGDDPIQGPRCTFHGQVFGCLSPFKLPAPYAIAAADGPQVVSVQVWDAAGNTATAQAMFTLDTVGPSASIDSHPIDDTANPVATFTFSSPDAIGFACQVDAAPFVACTSPFTAVVGDGPHTFRLHADDLAGNHTTRAHSWTVDTRPAVTTALGSYDPATAVAVSWRNLPGNATDWLAIAPVGSADGVVSQRVYTGGGAAGTIAVAAAGTLPAGSYVARAFVADGTTKVAESPPFAVAAVCAPLVYDSATAIHTPGDVTSLAPYTRLGPLTISTTSSFPITLPCLEQVASLLLNDNGGTHVVPELHAPRLTTITGAIDITNGPPVLDLPALTTLGGDFYVTQPVAPDISALARVTQLHNLVWAVSSGGLRPGDLPAVATLAPGTRIQVFGGAVDGFNQLRSTGSLFVGGDRIGGFNHVTAIDGLTLQGGAITGWRRLESINGTLNLTASGPQHLELPALDHLDGDLNATFFDPLLVTASLPLLRSANVINLLGSTLQPPALAAFEVPLVVSVPTRVLAHLLPHYSYCDFVALVNQVYPASLYPADHSGLNYGVSCP